MNTEFSSKIPVEAEPTPPAFNIPSIILFFGGLCVVVHCLRAYVFSSAMDYWILNVFSFVPGFYWVSPENLIQPFARYWAPISYSFLHGDFTHLLMNMVWLIAFGSAVARRLSMARFIVFMVLASCAGASAHFVFHSMSNVPVIGASGVVSACMGAAIRFAFASGNPQNDVSQNPRLSLINSLKNRNILLFLIIWFVFNWLFGAGIISLGIDSTIAWEAHMGGFLFGWLGFSLFDRKVQE